MCRFTCINRCSLLISLYRHLQYPPTPHFVSNIHIILSFLTVVHTLSLITVLFCSGEFALFKFTLVGLYYLSDFLIVYKLSCYVFPHRDLHIKSYSQESECLLSAIGTVVFVKILILLQLQSLYSVIYIKDESQHFNELFKSSL